MKGGRSYEKKLIALMITVAVAAGVALAGFAYRGFVSETIYEESTAHLVEFFHQANQTLYNWIVLGIVPTDVVNASMNKLQSITAAVVAMIFIALSVCLLLFVVQQNRQKLKLKDNELLARDDLFSKLSANVDDVFLMLNAENLRVDYVSPNIEKLLGISET